MKKLVLTALALCMGLVTATAQITTGESSAQVIRTGNRAEAGNFGIYLGGTSTMFKYLFFDEYTEEYTVKNTTNFEALPLINFKYMATDNLELRLGLEWWTATTGSKTVGEDENEDDYETRSKDKYTNKYVYPGLAYHFSNKNLLDVYVGAELPIGWESITATRFADYDDDDLCKDEKAVARDFKVGLGAFIGLQAYVANLPLAIGVEYGISSLKTLSSSKYITDEEQEYEAPKTTSNTWNVGQQARLTLTYFFKM